MLQERGSEDKDVRTRMLEALSKFNIKQVDVAREAGIHHSTLSLWLQGKVKGHHIGIEGTLGQWLQNLYSGKHRYTTLNKTTDKQFILTPPSINIKKKQKPIDAQDILVPVHLQFEQEIEGRKYKQVFYWNINDPYLNPQQYAKLVVSQNSLLPPYESKIVDAIKKAIYDYNRLGKYAKKEPCIKSILLDVKVSNMCLKDRFEWDINDADNSPQDFAYELCRQLNLNGEFMVKIAYQIRQQIDYYRVMMGNNQAMVTNQMNGMQNPTSMFDMKKSTRHLVQFAGIHNYGGQEQQNIITPENYIRLQNPYDWQPEIQILDAGEVRKFQTKEQRKNRYARRTTR